MTVELGYEEVKALLKILDFGTCSLPVCNPSLQPTQPQIDFIVILTKVQMKLQKAVLEHEKQTFQR